MTITRARKGPPPARNEKPGLTADAFIAGAEAPPDAPSVAAGPSPDSPVAAPSGRALQALAIVRSHMPWAAGAGVLPLPGVDLAAILGVQLRMLASVSACYGVPFREQAAKSMVATLMAAVLENSLAGGLAAALKLIPGLGTLLGIAALPALAAAGTWAVGKVFITHFEAGGTFLDFDPAKVDAHFRAEFETARRTGQR